MSSSSKGAPTRLSASDVPDHSTAAVAPMVLLGWLIPGAAHLVLGRGRKGLVFLTALLAMFIIGLGCHGQLFPFQGNEPLVFLAALAEWGVAAPRLGAWMLGYGAGQVTASTYEYGNTFLIAAGLLNALVVLDAADIASGRKP
jgi:hypothetical protein